MPRVRVCIVSWNACDDLRLCLQSLRSASADPSSVEVVVVDNASSDNSAEMVAAEFPDLRLIRLDDNTGFSGGNNIALEALDAPYAFLLNSDATCPPGGLDTLLDFADSNPDIGIVGPKVVNPDGTLQFSCRRWPTPSAGLFRNVYLGKLFPQNRPAADYLMRDFDHARVRDVDWVSGCALLIRKQCLDQIGPLDAASFFMYCEDMDWCLRAHQAGWRVTYFPEIAIPHRIGASSDHAADRMIVEHSRSMWRFWRKHRRFFAGKVPWWSGGLVLPWAILRAGVRIARRRIAPNRSWRKRGRP